jgi:geranylgeranyl pyrophosphate synthase
METSSRLTEDEEEDEEEKGKEQGLDLALGRKPVPVPLGERRAERDDAKAAEEGAHGEDELERARRVGGLGRAGTWVGCRLR